MGASPRASKTTTKKRAATRGATATRAAAAKPKGAPRASAIEAKPVPIAPTTPQKTRPRALEGPEAIKAVLLAATPKARELAETLRRLVKKASPDAREHAEAREGAIVFERRKPFCSIAPGNEHVIFTFHRGSDLDDPESLLAGGGKGARHIRVAQVQDIRGGAFERFVRQASQIAAK